MRGAAFLCSLLTGVPFAPSRFCSRSHRVVRSQVSADSVCPAKQTCFFTTSIVPKSHGMRRLRHPGELTCDCPRGHISSARHSGRGCVSGRISPRALANAAMLRPRAGSGPARGVAADRGSVQERIPAQLAALEDEISRLEERLAGAEKGSVVSLHPAHHLRLPRRRRGPTRPAGAKRRWRGQRVPARPHRPHRDRAAAGQRPSQPGHSRKARRAHGLATRSHRNHGGGGGGAQGRNRTTDTVIFSNVVSVFSIEFSYPRLASKRTSTYYCNDLLNTIALFCAL